MQKDYKMNKEVIIKKNILDCKWKLAEIKWHLDQYQKEYQEEEGKMNKLISDLHLARLKKWCPKK